MRRNDWSHAEAFVDSSKVGRNHSFSAASVDSVLEDNRFLKRHGKHDVLTIFFRIFFSNFRKMHFATEWCDGASLDFDIFLLGVLLTSRDNDDASD